VGKFNPTLALWVLFSTGCLLSCGGAPKEADSMDEMPDLAPEKRKTVRLALIQTLVEKKAYDSAVPLLNRALREESKNAQLYGLRAVILRERGRLEEARKEFLKSISLEARNPMALGGLGVTLNLLGEHTLASQRHKAAIELAPSSPQLLNNYGFSLFLERKYPESVEQYESAIRSDPRMHIAYVNLGFALAVQGKRHEARRAFEQVLQASEVLNNLALAEEMRGRPDEARALYTKAIADHPNLSAAVDNLKALDASTAQPKESP